MILQDRNTDGKRSQIGAFSIFYIVAKLPYIFGAACSLSSTCTLYIYYYCSIHVSPYRDYTLQNKEKNLTILKVVENTPFPMFYPCSL